MIGVGSGHRSSEFPQVPTISESGVPGFEQSPGLVWLAPANSAGIIKKINQDVAKVLTDKAFAKEYLAAQGLEPITVRPNNLPHLFDPRRSSGARSSKTPKSPSPIAFAERRQVTGGLLPSASDRGGSSRRSCAHAFRRRSVRFHHARSL